VRRFLRRGVRLELVAALCVALSVPALGVTSEPEAAGSAASLTTQTSILAVTHDLHGHTQVSVTVTVLGEDGLPASGAVSLRDGGHDLAGAALDAKGEAHLTVDLAAGSHALQAAYVGDGSHLKSISEVTRVEAQVSTIPTFTVAVAPTTMSLTPGQSGTVTATITPVNSSNLSAPMFVTLSCSGLPDEAACVFSPENLEILPNATAGVISTMSITTQIGSQSDAMARPVSTPVSLAILLPGVFALGGLAWSARRRAWLQRLSLLGLVALVSILGATACNPRYDYFNHGPPANRETPAGSYTVIVAAQSSNGVTAITNTTDLALTVTALNTAQ
jgi:hypothetical protein